MIDYDKNLEDMTMSCDECEDGEESVGGSWQECIDELKSRGWKIKKENENWIHICSECQEDELKYNEEIV